jgi:hypothetical protein
MRSRKLRIAWSMFWGLVCALLVVLWAQSYSRQSFWFGDDAEGGFLVLSTLRGDVEVRCSLPPPSVVGIKWRRDYGRMVSDDGAERTIAPLRFYREPEVFEVAADCWLMVTASCGAAASPWIRWSNPFSLRTLLIATTLVAVVLGLAVVMR